MKGLEFCYMVLRVSATYCLCLALTKILTQSQNIITINIQKTQRFAHAYLCAFPVTHKLMVVRH